MTGGVPVPDDLESDDAVDGAADDVGEDHDLVTGFLDAGEDPGNQSKVRIVLCQSEESIYLAIAPRASKKLVIAESCPVCPFLKLATICRNFPVKIELI